MDCVFDDGSDVSEEGFEERILQELDDYSDEDLASMNQSCTSIKAANRNMSNLTNSNHFSNCSPEQYADYYKKKLEDEAKQTSKWDQYKSRDFERESMFQKFEKNVTKLKRITQEDMVEAEPEISDVSEVVTSSDIEDEEGQSGKKLKEHKNISAPMNDVFLEDYKVLGKSGQKGLGQVPG